ncbi:MAG: box helicase [Hydrocarboniphaga sp.]|nr:DNA primase small subunit domain-containing protein [Hydrocarboniphaga sp.]MDB5970670.1 box helicase [Hydrocarboniphaga sp.]
MNILPIHADDSADALNRLRTENARLVSILERNGIDWCEPEAIAPQAAASPDVSRLSTDEKVALFRRLFRGRPDVYALRWEGKSGKTGYAPACANEWKAGICEKPRIKCAECPHRQFLPVTDRAIHEHLAGKITIGVYPLLQDETCHFLAADFDEADWREDAQAFMLSCQELQVPASLEISRSGKGAHAWVFFASAVAARDARRLGTAIISHTCIRTRQLRLSSYDRLFPNQDTMPKGGFGNLIALPLQKKPREQGPRRHGVCVSNGCGSRGSVASRTHVASLRHRGGDTALSWTSGFSLTRISGDTSPQ